MTCTHPDRLAMYDGYLHEVERCTVCNEVTTEIPTLCGCRTEYATDILGRYPVRVRCATHSTLPCAYCERPVSPHYRYVDEEDFARMTERGLTPRVWCSAAHLEADAERSA